MPEPASEFDVLIVGGGMVGAALALGLATQPHTAELRVGLVERAPPAPPPPAAQPSLRVSALTRASQNLLVRLGAWDPEIAARATPYRAMRVWNDPAQHGDWGELAFDAGELGEPDLGHIVENAVIQHALWQRLETAPVELVCPAELADLTLSARSAEVTLVDGRILRASLLVAADGAESRVRKLAGLASRGWDYDQRGVVANLVASKGHADTAWQHFLPDGPLALLPMQGNLVSIVWSTSPAAAEALLALDEPGFAARVTEASEGRLGELQLVSRRAAFPLRLRHAPSYVGERLALVGDAAHVVHPLAGQGVNLGFLDVATLIEVLQWAVVRDRPLGALPTLRRYERARKGHNLVMLGAMDGLKRLFSNDSAALGVARNLGLGAVQRLPWLRRWFATRAMGLDSDLPLLVRHLPS